MEMLKCDLCGDINPTVKTETGKTYKQCCQDYRGCEKRRQDLLVERYRNQKIQRFMRGL